MAGSKPSNWLRSDVIKATEAKGIEVTVEFTAKKCSSISVAKPFCRHDFDLYVYQTTRKFPNDHWPIPPPIGGYKKISNVTATDLGVGQSKPTNTKTLSIPINDRGYYVLLAVHDQGACLDLLSFRVSYNVCPSSTLPAVLMRLPRTVAPNVTSDAIKVNGSCIANSVSVSGETYAFCQSNGEWNTSERVKCLCKRGFTKTGKECKGSRFYMTCSLFYGIKRPKKGHHMELLSWRISKAKLSPMFAPVVSYFE